MALLYRWLIVGYSQVQFFNSFITVLTIKSLTTSIRITLVVPESFAAAVSRSLYQKKCLGKLQPCLFPTKTTSFNLNRFCHQPPFPSHALDDGLRRRRSRAQAAHDLHMRRMPRRERDQAQGHHPLPGVRLQDHVQEEDQEAHRFRRKMRTKRKKMVIIECQEE